MLITGRARPPAVCELCWDQGSGGWQTHHEVLDTVAQLVNEQDGQVVHRLPQLDPGGRAIFRSPGGSHTQED